jgi:hypothetical protein
MWAQPVHVYLKAINMPVSWISLPANWKLEDVQAALNVIIGVLSALSIYVFARVCWVDAASRVARHQPVELSSLTSLNTLGEACDVIGLLKTKILSRRYLKILTQCIVIFTLSAAAIFSGPIAKYSTKRSHVIGQIEVTGWLAVRYFGSMGYANVQWNQIQTSLDRANFPTDQLLDFLPDTSVNWIYRAEEWSNSTWSMACNSTPSTPISLTDTGNCNATRLSHAEIPGMSEVMPKVYDSYDERWNGFRVNSTLLQDVLMIAYGEAFLNYDNTTNTTYAMSNSIASLNLHDVPNQADPNSTCYFAAGKIGAASYTRVDCDLTRRQHVQISEDTAFPDCGGVVDLASAYIHYHQARFNQESILRVPITTITPEDMKRFYQVYMIAKDTEFRNQVTRKLSVVLPNVALSTVFLALALLIALLIAAGISRYGLFVLKHRKASLLAPEGKLDWILQSVKGDGLNPSTTSSSLRGSVTLTSNKDVCGLSPQERKRTEFEAAIYDTSSESPPRNSYRSLHQAPDATNEVTFVWEVADVDRQLVRKS